MTDQPLTDTAVPAATEQPGRRPDPIQRLAVFAVRWLIIRPGWWLLRRLGRELWRGRDLHAVWWVAVATYIATATAYATGVPWWAVAAAAVAFAVAAHQAQSRWPWLPAEPDTVAGVVAVAGVWSAVAVAAVPWSRPAAAAWAVWAVAVTVWWWRDRDARAWRHLRARVRNWSSALPVVLAELGAAGVVLAARPRIEPGGRVLFPLRLTAAITRGRLDRMRKEIETGMHWREGSIKEIRHDPDHASAARVLLVWQDGQIRAREVHLELAKVPSTIYDPLWLGIDDQGRDVLAEQYAATGMTRGLYGGESGSAKSNLLRLIARLRAYCPDAALWVADRKNSGLTFAALLPRIDWIATDRDEAIRMLEAFAVGIPLRGRLLRPEHNQLLPLSSEVPAVILIYDEFAEELGKKQANRAAVDAARVGFSQGRATGWGAEIASQYLSQGSLHPDLKPLLPRNVCGRTRERADAQFVLRDWTRVDTTLLPTGSFYVQLPGESHLRLLHTPEVTDEMLAQAAAETAHLTPRLEEATAAELPHYADRWGRLPDHLLEYCSDEQRAMVEASRAKPAASGTRLRTAAASPPGRLVVHERIDGDEIVDDDEVLDIGDGAALDPALAAMCDVLEAAANAGEEVRTGDLVAAAEARGRKRSWAMARVGAWPEGGVTTGTGRRGWWRVSCPAGEVRSRVAAVEGTLARGRRWPAARGGDGR